jgi:hypothetical protein
MNMRSRLLIGLAATLLLAAWALPTDPADVKSDVPALFAFHDVIYPLWHNAWPNKDLALMKELSPQIRAHMTELEKAKLPGILRDKQAKWDEGVRAMAVSVAKYEQAIAGGELQPCLDAAEELHARYEGLVRMVRPVMKELDAYHQVLYQVYHYQWPAKDLTALRASGAELAKACETLQAAAVPKRFEAKTEALKTAFATLCGATAELNQALAGEDWKVIDTALETMHTRYQDVEKVFEK